MARSAKISKEQAIRSAINAFWRYGYSAMGVRRLEEETGINRFMLQTVFGGKGGIFFLVLDEYTLLFKNLLFDPLAKGDISNIQEFFELRTTDNSFTKPEYGCLIINTLSEDLVNEPEIRKRVNKHFSLMRQSFNSALKNEMAKGTLHDDFEPNKASEFLMNTAVGLNVVMRNDGSNQNALLTLEMVKNTLRSWKK